MLRSTMRIDHQVPITSPKMFSSPYREIPIDRMTRADSKR